MILRPYQHVAAAAAVRELQAGRRVVLALPTGAGKTVVGASVVASLGLRTTWLTHRRELAEQARRALPAGTRVESVAKRTTTPASLLVLDEGHHVSAASWMRHVNAHSGPTLLLTATPFRLDGRGLGEAADSVVHVLWPADEPPRAVVETEGELTLAAALIREGTLIEPRYYALPGGDVSGLKKRAGDYATEQAAAAFDRPKVAGDAVREYRTRAAGRRAVAFCVTVEHAEHVAAAFRDAGTPAEVVSGSMPKAERDAVLARLRSGETHVVATVMVLTEGWDLPALEVAIILRPTASKCLHLQMLGRVMRAAEGKAGALVLDHAGNVRRLGPVSAPVAFALAGRQKRESVATGLKLCESCYLLVPSSSVVCPSCGSPFGTEDDAGPDLTAGLGGAETLVEVDPKTPDGFTRIAHDGILWASLRATRSVAEAKVEYRRATNTYPTLDAAGELVDPNTERGRKWDYFDMLERCRRRGDYIGRAAGHFRAKYGRMAPYAWRETYLARCAERGLDVVTERDAS